LTKLLITCYPILPWRNLDLLAIVVSINRDSHYETTSYGTWFLLYSLSQ